MSPASSRPLACSSLKPVLAMVAAAALWSTSGLLIKVISLDAVSLASWRSAVAGIVLILITRTRKIPIGFPSSRLLLLAVGTYAANLIAFPAATKLTTAANAIFLQYTAPIYVLLLEPAFLKTRLRMRDVGFVGIAVFGMSLFFLGRIEVGQQLGNLLGAACGMLFAIFAVSMRARHQERASLWQVIVWGNCMLAISVFGVLFIRTGAIPLPMTTAELAGILFLGAFQIALAYVLFTYAIARLSALETVLLGMLEPVLNPVWVYFGTGELPTGWGVLGGILIIGAVFARTWMAQREESIVGGSSEVAD